MNEFQTTASDLTFDPLVQRKSTSFGMPHDAASLAQGPPGAQAVAGNVSGQAGATAASSGGMSLDPFARSSMNMNAMSQQQIGYQQQQQQQQQAVVQGAGQQNLDPWGGLVNLNNLQIAGSSQSSMRGSDQFNIQKGAGYGMAGHGAVPNTNMGFTQYQQPQQQGQQQQFGM